MFMDKQRLTQRIIIIFCSLWLLSACATSAPTAQTLTFDAETVSGTHQLTITTTNAQDTNATARNGSYTVRMLTRADTQGMFVKILSTA